MTTRFKPAVSRHHLLALAGLAWTIAGGILCIRAAFWLLDLPTVVAVAIGSSGILGAAAAYLSLFSRLVRKNIDRIALLPERPCAFAFTAWRGYIMIAVMMTVGITLRSGVVPTVYLALPYTAMGSVLLTGSAGFYREYARVSRNEREDGR
ncbi:MAG TPA: hypothetical protein VEO56_00770 [Bacteroidota bacterium]|nr:hypothetical protein [Bacteroidota bacterium]